MLVYNEIYLHCRYVNKSNINVHITSHEWGHEVLTLELMDIQDIWYSDHTQEDSNNYLLTKGSNKLQSQLMEILNF